MAIIYHEDAFIHKEIGQPDKGMGNGTYQLH